MPVNKIYSVFIYILMFLSQFFCFFSLASLSLRLIFLGLFTSLSLLLTFLLFTAVQSFGPKCVTLGCWRPLLPKPRRSLLRTVLMGNFLPAPSGPKPVQKEINKTMLIFWGYHCVSQVWSQLHNFMDLQNKIRNEVTIVTSHPEFGRSLVQMQLET